MTYPLHTSLPSCKKVSCERPVVLILFQSLQVNPNVLQRWVNLDSHWTVRSWDPALSALSLCGAECPAAHGLMRKASTWAKPSLLCCTHRFLLHPVLTLCPVQVSYLC